MITELPTAGQKPGSTLTVTTLFSSRSTVSIVYSVAVDLRDADADQETNSSVCARVDRRAHFGQGGQLHLLIL